MKFLLAASYYISKYFIYRAALSCLNIKTAYNIEYETDYQVGSS